MAPYLLMKARLNSLIYPALGLFVILMFIGVKLILAYPHEVFAEIPKIPTIGSLAVIAGIPSISTLASLLKSKAEP